MARRTLPEWLHEGAQVARWTRTHNGIDIKVVTVGHVTRTTAVVDTLIWRDVNTEGKPNIHSIGEAGLASTVLLPLDDPMVVAELERRSNG